MTIYFPNNAFFKINNSYRNQRFITFDKIITYNINSLNYAHFSLDGLHNNISTVLK